MESDDRSISEQGQTLEGQTSSGSSSCLAERLSGTKIHRQIKSPIPNEPVKLMGL